MIYPTMALLGGVFDPVHLGHLNIATQLENKFHFDQVRFIPCKQQVLKHDAHVSAQHRLAMLQLALEDFPNFTIDTLELDRDTPSFTYLTLETLREKFPTHSLIWIIGADVLRNFSAWRHWESLLDRAHFLVVNRPGFSFKLENVLESFIEERKTSNFDLLKQNTHGYFFFEAMEAFAISSSEIRQAISEKKSIQAWVPRKVASYIHNHHLY